jgi:hypothetical protein
MSEAFDIAGRHVAAFNEAVVTGDFSEFLDRFDAAAVIRFENVPSVGALEFAGRTAYTQAYAQLPPDDQIDIAGPPSDDGGSVVIPFAWRRDGSRGTMRLGLAGDRIMSMTITFA